MKYRRLRANAKRDANEPELVAALRKVGGYWIPLGWPVDGVAGAPRGQATRLVLIEIKDGSKPPHKRKLTDDQQEFLRDCQSYGLPFAVVETVDDLLRAVGVVR